MKMSENRTVPNELPAIFRAVDDSRVEWITRLGLLECRPEHVEEMAQVTAEVAEDYGLDPDAMALAIQIHEGSLHL